MGQIKLMFSLEHFTFHRKIFQTSELKVRRREKSVHILSVSVTLVWVIMPHTWGFVFIIVCILVQGLNFYCTWGFKLIFEISCSPHIFFLGFVLICSQIFCAELSLLHSGMSVPE